MVDPSPCALWGDEQPPGALGMAEPETAVKAGWGLDGREVGENVCVRWGKGWKHISLAFFSPSFPSRAGEEGTQGL